MVKRYYNAVVAEKEGKKTAKAMVTNAHASPKFSTEICNQLKGKSLAWSQALLQDILEHKRFLPLKRYNKKVGHRKGASVSGEKAGRYPDKTVKVFQKLLGNAKANADYKGLDVEKLVVWHAFASPGFGRRHLQSKGRIGGKLRKRKSSHIEVILLETR